MMNQSRQKAQNVEKKKNQDEDNNISFEQLSSERKNIVENQNDNPQPTEDRASLEVSNDQEAISQKKFINLTKKKWILISMLSMMIIIIIVVVVLVTQMFKKAQMQNYKDKEFGILATIRQNSTAIHISFSSLKVGDDRVFCQTMIEQGQDGKEKQKVFCEENELQVNGSGSEVRTNFVSVDDIQDSQAPSTGNQVMSLSAEVSYQEQANGMTAKTTTNNFQTDLCYPKCKWDKWIPICSNHCEKVIFFSLTEKECVNINPQCGAKCTNNKCECGVSNHWCPYKYTAFQPGTDKCGCQDIA